MRDRPRDDGQAAPAHARRALDGPRADLRRPDLRDDRRDQQGGHADPARRAERADGARRRRPRLRPPDGDDRARGRRRRSFSRTRTSARRTSASSNAAREPHASSYFSRPHERRRSRCARSCSPPSTVATAAVIVSAATASSGEDHAAGRALRRPGKIVYCTDATYPPEEFFRGSKIDRLRRRLRRRHREADGREGGAQEHDLRLDHPRAAREEVRRDHQRHERHGRAPQAGRLRRLPEDRPVDHRAEGEPEARVVTRQPLRASACRSSPGRRTATSCRDLEEARQAGQEGDHDRHVPEGHGLLRRAARRPCRRVLRGFASGRVLREAELDEGRRSPATRSTRSPSGSPSARAIRCGPRRRRRSPPCTRRAR